MVQFARQLKIKAMEMGPPPKIFKELTGDALRSRLYNVLVDIVKASIVSTIRSKYNIYEKVLLKDKMFAHKY